MFHPCVNNSLSLATPRKIVWLRHWCRYLRAALHSDRGNLLLVAVSVEARHVVVYDLDLLACEVGILVQHDLVLLAVLNRARMERRGVKK